MSDTEENKAAILTDASSSSLSTSSSDSESDNENVPKPTGDEPAPEDTEEKEVISDTPVEVKQEKEAQVEQTKVVEEKALHTETPAPTEQEVKPDTANEASKEPEHDKEEKVEEKVDKPQEQEVHEEAKGANEEKEERPHEQEPHEEHKEPTKDQEEKEPRETHKVQTEEQSETEQEKTQEEKPQEQEKHEEQPKVDDKHENEQEETETPKEVPQAQPEEREKEPERVQEVKEVKRTESAGISVKSERAEDSASSSSSSRGEQSRPDEITAAAETLNEDAAEKAADALYEWAGELKKKGRKMAGWHTRKYQISKELLEEVKGKKVAKAYALMRCSPAQVMPTLRNGIEITIEGDKGKSKKLILTASRMDHWTEFISAFNTARDNAIALAKPFDFDNLSPQHAQVLAEMKEKVPDADVFPKLATDNSLLMFLRLKNFDVKSAVDEYKKVLFWRTKNPEMNNVKITDVWKSVEAGYLYVLPAEQRDLLGRPVLIMDYTKMPRHEVGPCIQTWAYIMDRAEELMLQNKSEKVTVIMNIKDFDVVKADKTFIKLWGLMMNAFYPHRNKPIVYIINSPRMVKGMIGLVKKFINADLFQSITVFGTDLQPLNPIYPLSRLPTTLGGTYEFDLMTWIRNRADMERVTEADIKEPNKDFMTHILPNLKDPKLSAEHVLNEGLVLKQGWMEKEGGSIRTRKRRFCVLKTDALYYFKDDKEERTSWVQALNAVYK